MLQFHWWDDSNPGYLDALKHITDLKEEGKIKTVALTNFDTDRLQIILENEIPVVSNQVYFSTSIVYTKDFFSSVIVWPSDKWEMVAIVRFNIPSLICALSKEWQSFAS
jgi:hypothetical protein